MYGMPGKELLSQKVNREKRYEYKQRKSEGGQDFLGNGLQKRVRIFSDRL